MHMNSMQKRNCNCTCNTNMPCNNCNLQDTSRDDERSNMYQTACSDVENYNNMYDNCACGFDEENSFFPENPMFAQSYVPIQTMDKVFIPSVGLKMGTIFPELVSPYMPGQSQEEINYIRNQNTINEGCNG